MEKERDRKVGCVYDLLYALVNDLNAGRSREKDVYDNYIARVGGETYYCDVSASINGRQVDYKHTLAYKIQQDAEAVREAICTSRYFQCNSNVACYMEDQLHTFTHQIKVNGNLHQRWYDFEPRYFAPASTQPGDAGQIAPLRLALESAQHVTVVSFTHGDDV